MALQIETGPTVFPMRRLELILFHNQGVLIFHVENAARGSR